MTIGGSLREKFEHFREYLGKTDRSTIHSIVNLYIRDFGGGKTALERLSEKERKYYQIEYNYPKT